MIITNLFLKDAYFATKDDELFLAVQSLQSIIELNPDLANELDPYLVKLETKMENQNTGGNKNYAEEYIKSRKQETIPDYTQIVQLGMTEKEVTEIKGRPKYINKLSEARRQFQMWIYVTDSTTSHLYFENNMLVRIEE